MESDDRRPVEGERVRVIHRGSGAYGREGVVTHAKGSDVDVLFDGDDEPHGLEYEQIAIMRASEPTEAIAREAYKSTQLDREDLRSSWESLSNRKRDRYITFASHVIRIAGKEST